MVTLLQYHGTVLSVCSQSTCAITHADFPNMLLLFNKAAFNNLYYWHRCAASVHSRIKIFDVNFEVYCKWLFLLILSWLIILKGSSHLYIRATFSTFVVIVIICIIYLIANRSNIQPNFSVAFVMDTNKNKSFEDLLKHWNSKPYSGVNNYTEYATVQQNKSMNQARIVVINKISLWYPITVPACTKEQRAFVAIISAPNYFKKREIIRDTWIQHIDFTVNIAFVIGLTPDPAIQKETEKESSNHGYIVQIDMVDNYWNLTLKDIAYSTGWTSTVLKSTSSTSAMTTSTSTLTTWVVTSWVPSSKHCHEMRKPFMEQNEIIFCSGRKEQWI